MFSLTYPHWISITENNLNILILQQEINLFGETVSLTIFLFQYMNLLSKRYNLKVLIAPKMTYLITLLDNSRKSAVYTGGNIHGIYIYIDMIGYPKTFITSGQSSRHFVSLSSIKNDTAYLQPVIAALRMRHNIMCECWGSIGHKSDACIIRGPKFLPPSLRININQFNALHGEEPNEPPIEWNSQPPAARFKSRTSTPNTSPVVSAIMGIIHNNSIDNGGVEVHPSDIPV